MVKRFSHDLAEIPGEMEVDVKDDQGSSSEIVIESFVKNILSMPLIAERWINSWKMVSIVESISSQDGSLWQQLLHCISSHVINFWCLQFP